MKKNKKLLVIATTILIILILVDCLVALISGFTSSQNKELGLKLSLSNVSAQGATITLERGVSEKAEDVTIGHSYVIQKRCFLGWRDMKLKGPYGFVDYGIGLEEGEVHDWNVNWKHMYGRLWPGVYRIGGLMSDAELYKPFLVLF